VWPGLDQRVTDARGEHLLLAGRSAMLVGLDMSNPEIKALLTQAFAIIGPKETITVTCDGIIPQAGDGLPGLGLRRPPASKTGVY